jgi:hypothetical protein
MDANSRQISQSKKDSHRPQVSPNKHNKATMSDDEDIAALVIDNGSGMCKGTRERIVRATTATTVDGGVCTATIWRETKSVTVCGQHVPCGHFACDPHWYASAEPIVSKCAQCSHACRNTPCQVRRINVLCSAAE